MSHRFFSATLPEAGTVVIDGPEAHHLSHVMRVAVDEEVELFDGNGLVAMARVAALRKRDVELVVFNSRREVASARTTIIASAVPKGDRFDWLIEKITELGVTRFIPLLTARSVVDPRASKLDKLRQTVITACKQCGRNRLLDLQPVLPWKDLVEREIPRHDSYIAHPIIEPGMEVSAGSRDVNVATPADASILVAIGPEGGFTDEELRQAIDAGARPLSLGSHVLRIETAAIAAAVRMTSESWSD